MDYEITDSDINFLDLTLLISSFHKHGIAEGIRGGSASGPGGVPHCSGGHLPGEMDEEEFGIQLHFQLHFQAHFNPISTRF